MRHATSGPSLLLLISYLFTAAVSIAATRYVDPTCPDSATYNPSTRACTGGSDVSRTTISGCIGLMAAGDICYIRGSLTSTPTISGGKIVNPPSGTSASNRTVISAYPINRTCSGHNPADVTTCLGSTYENVVLKPTSSPVVDIRGAGPSPGPIRDPKWITIEGLRVDASTSGGKGIVITGGGAKKTNFPACDNGSKDFNTTPDHLRFLNMEVFGSPSSGYLGDIYNENIELIGNYFWNNGLDLGTDHGMYYGGSNGRLYGNRLENNRTYGLHLYGQPAGAFDNPGCEPFPSGNVVENNIAVGNRDGFGVLRGHKNTTLRNNLAYGNARFGIHVSSSNGGTNKIYNNTAIANGQQSFYVGEFADNSIFRNNIYQRIFIETGADGLVFSNNYDWCTTCTAPAFVDAAAAVPDLRLRAGDARIDAGTNLTSEGVTKDFAGNARPAGAGFDIGAYEFNASGPPVQSFDFSVATDVDGLAGLTIVQGATDTITVTVTRLAGTAAEVTLTATGLPTGTTLMFSPTSCTPATTTCTSVGTVDVPNTTPEGTYTVNVRATTGTGPGALTRSTPFTLIVSCN